MTGGPHFIPNSWCRARHLGSLLIESWKRRFGLCLRGLKFCMARLPMIPHVCRTGKALTATEPNSDSKQQRKSPLDFFSATLAASFLIPPPPPFPGWEIELPGPPPQKPEIDWGNGFRLEHAKRHLSLSQKRQKALNCSRLVTDNSLGLLASPRAVPPPSNT